MEVKGDHDNRMPSYVGSTWCRQFSEDPLSPDIKVKHKVLDCRNCSQKRVKLFIKSQTYCRTWAGGGGRRPLKIHCRFLAAVRSWPWKCEHEVTAHIHQFLILTELNESLLCVSSLGCGKKPSTVPGLGHFPSVLLCIINRDIMGQTCIEQMWSSPFC